MDTLEARILMRDLADEGLKIVDRYVAGNLPSGADKRRLRELVIEARTALSDAGYPGEAVWRSLHRASMGADTLFDQSDDHYWPSVVDELRAGLDTLESLISPGFRRESDFHIVG